MSLRAYYLAIKPLKMLKNGGTYAIRTHDLTLRRRMLYPAELMHHIKFLVF
jgi:hypothetical protein